MDLKQNPQKDLKTKLISWGIKLLVAHFPLCKTIFELTSFIPWFTVQLFIIQGLIYGCNSVPVKIKEIQSIIVSKELLNKPKILILQSCQGEETQIAEPVTIDCSLPYIITILTFHHTPPK